MHDRAAQFAPFAALTGYEAAEGETARLTSEKRELDAQEAEELNRRLASLIARLPDRPEVTIGYFVHCCNGFQQKSEFFALARRLKKGIKWRSVFKTNIPSLKLDFNLEKLRIFV